MHAFRCTRCRAASYSAARLERLPAGGRCARCGGELETAARESAFSAFRAAAGEAPGRYPLRPGARSSAG